MKGLLYLLGPILLLTPLSIHEKTDGYRGLSSSWNTIQSRSLAGLHYIFKGFENDEDEDVMRVTGPVVEVIKGDKAQVTIHKEGYVSEIDPEDFEQEQILGQSVFESLSGSGSNVGTAFLVGSNIVLTNRHILSLTAQDKEWACGKFSVKLNHKEERVGCKKVRFCSFRYDYCVVELNKMMNGLSVGTEVRSLRLTNKIKSNREQWYMHIGNAGGLGIQASRGRGIRIKSGEFYHFVPTLGGSSGAPVFDERGDVIGLNWAHTGQDFIDETAYNRGVLATTIYQELKKTHPYTLKDIKSFKSWARREGGPRKIQMKTE